MQYPINAIGHKLLSVGKVGLSHEVEYMGGINMQIMFWSSVIESED